MDLLVRAEPVGREITIVVRAVERVGAPCVIEPRNVLAVDLIR